MFTSIDKALAAFFMAAVYVANQFVERDISAVITEDMVSGLVAVLTPALVYLIPNKETPE